MELARDKQTGQEVYAIDLRQQVLEQKDPIASQKMLAQLTAKEYICLGCESFMTPVAIKPDMKVSPHFRIKKKEQHQENCHISRYDNLVQVGLTDYNSRKQPWLFFFGKQSPQNKFQFQLIRDDWRLLYCQTIQVSNLSNL